MMPQSQKYILNDLVTSRSEHVIRFYRVPGRTLHLEKTIKAPCKHGSTRLFGLMIGQEEFLALGCMYCKSIRLLNLETEQVTEAFCDVRARDMCHGRQGRMFVITQNDEVIELDCSSSRFTRIQTIYTGLEECRDVYYLPMNDCVVVCRGDEVRAVSCRDGSVVWRVQGEVDGKKIDPQGFLLYNGGLFMADGSNSRIVVLNANDGSFIKTIKTPGLGKIICLNLSKTQIVIVLYHFAPDRKYKFSAFDVK